MSNQVRLDTQIKNKATLIAALDELGYAYAEDGTLIDYFGKNRGKVDLLVTVGGKTDRVGFKKNGEMFELVGDFDGVGITSKKFQSAVTRTYMSKEVLTQLKRKRFSVVSNETTNTGSIKIRARQMVA